MKTGFDYYNTDTDRYQDKRIKRLKISFSAAGIAVYDYILCEIYRVKGCFIEWDESTAFDVADYFGLKESLVNEIVNYCCAVGLFNKELLMGGRVLTSKSIQSRYMEMSRRAKRKGVKVPEEIAILPEETGKLPEEEPIVPEETPKVPSYSKVEKSKGEKENTKRKSADESESFSDEQKKEFESMQKWILEKAPRVAKMESPLTISEFVKIKERFDPLAVAEILRKMHNHKPLLKNNVSTYLTICNWLGRNEK